MRAITIFLFALPICLSGHSAASAQNLGPADPDVVMECFTDGKASRACEFVCGSELDQASGGKYVTWRFVDRVEFFHKDRVGRTDTRTWIFVSSRASDNGDQNVTALNIGPNIYCFSSVSKVIGGPQKVEFRFTRFKFE